MLKHMMLYYMALAWGGGELLVTFPGLSPGIWEKRANPPSNPCNKKRHERDRELKDECLGLCVGKTHKLKCHKAGGGGGRGSPGNISDPPKCFHETIGN